MAWTLADMRDRLRTSLGLPESSGVKDSELDSYLNSVLRFVLPLTLYPPALKRTFYINTVSGERRYGVDPNMLSVVGTPYIEGVQMRLTYDYDWFFRNTTDKEGEPNFCLLHEWVLFLEPVPDKSYEITVVALARPDKMENDDDTIFLDSWALPTIYGAGIEFSRDRGDLETASNLQELWKYSTDIARREELLQNTNRRAKPQL